MARSIKRRRLESKTDYNSRLALLKSDKPRLVIRKTNRYIIAQLIESKQAQDSVIAGVNSKSLLTKGWPKEKSGSLKSMPAAYLTGLMLGKAAKGKVKEAILDIGMQRNIQKSKLYSALKGVVDSGINIPCSPDALPSLESLSNNKNLGGIFDKLKDKV